MNFKMTKSKQEEKLRKSVCKVIGRDEAEKYEKIEKKTKNKIKRSS